MFNKRTASALSRISRIRSQANAIIEAELSARGMSGLVPAHGSVLACLYANQGPVPMKSIVEFTGRAKSTVTVMIRTLEKHGYISRVRSTDDGRVTLVALAPRGVEIQKDFDEISTQLLSTFYGIMPAEQRALLIDLLEQVESNFTN